MSSSESIASYDLFVTLDDPRQQSKMKHDLAEVLRGVPSHNTRGCLLSLIDPPAFSEVFRRGATA